MASERERRLEENRAALLGRGEAANAGEKVQLLRPRDGGGKLSASQRLAHIFCGQTSCDW
jgi:hypothetical protein